MRHTVNSKIGDLILFGTIKVELEILVLAERERPIIADISSSESLNLNRRNWSLFYNNLELSAASIRTEVRLDFKLKRANSIRNEVVRRRREVVGRYKHTIEIEFITTGVVRLGSRRIEIYNLISTERHNSIVVILDAVKVHSRDLNILVLTELPNIRRDFTSTITYYEVNVMEISRWIDMEGETRNTSC